MIAAIQTPHIQQSQWASWNSRNLNIYVPQHVPEEEREQYAEVTSLRQFYLDCGTRWQAIGRKSTRANGTASKDRQALNRWEKFTRPDEWQGEWPGPSLAFIEQVGEQYFDAVWATMEAGGLSRETVKSTRSHIQGIIRHAHRVRAIERIPSSLPLGKKDPETRIYTPAEVERIRKALESFPFLDAAFQLILDAGPRAVDAFSLRWDAIREDHLGRKILCFESHKTSKLQGIPLTRSSLEILGRLPRTSEMMFGPAASSPDAKDPERSYQARLRNTQMKHLLISLGITDIVKPWQVARATCNERYESHAPGVGTFILGHSLTGVNARSYRQPTEAVHKAVQTLPAYTHIERQRRLF